MGQRLSAHFQAEKECCCGSGARPAAQCDVLREIEGERGFSHGRAGCDDEEFARLKTAGQFVEIEIPRREPADRTPFIGFEHLHCLMQQFFELFCGGGLRFLSDFKDQPFGFVEDFAGAVRAELSSVVGVINNLARSVDQLAKLVFFADDPRVVCCVDGRRGGLAEPNEILRPADRFERVVVLEHLDELYKVAALVRVVMVDQRVVDDFVRVGVERIARADVVQRVTDDGGVEDH